MSKWEKNPLSSNISEQQPTPPAGASARPEPRAQLTAVELLRQAGERAMRAYPAAYNTVVAPNQKGPNE